MSTIAIDTSVAIPLLVQTHEAHAAVRQWWQGRITALSGHALVESYAVLTRLPGELRAAPDEAAWLLREQFAAPLTLSPTMTSRLPDVLAGLGIAGGAVYDALVGLAAVEHGVELATRDARAKATYDVVGARVVIVA